MSCLRGPWQWDQDLSLLHEFHWLARLAQLLKGLSYKHEDPSFNPHLWHTPITPEMCAMWRQMDLRNGYPVCLKKNNVEHNREKVLVSTYGLHTEYLSMEEHPHCILQSINWKENKWNISDNCQMLFMEHFISWYSYVTKVNYPIFYLNIVNLNYSFCYH